MKFFRKSSPAESVQHTEQPVPEQAPQLITPSQDQTPEEAAKQWFSTQFGTDLPKEVLQLFRHLAQIEAKRQKVGEHILDANELRKIQEAIRLYQTKQTNITQTLNGLLAQKEWLHKFNELSHTLSKHKQAYYESNKQYNSHLKEIKELERFETFECVLGQFQQIKAKEKALQEIRQEIKSLAANLKQQLQKHKDKQTEEDAAIKKYQDMLEQWTAMQETVAEGYQLQTVLKLYQDELSSLEEEQLQTSQHVQDLHLAVKEQHEELKKCLKKQNDLQQQLQNQESQRLMLEKGDVIQAQLSFLYSLKGRKEKIQHSLEQTLKKQNEQNEQLNRLFSASQSLDAQINTLQSELHVHQKSIVGLNSYALQKRAMELKSNKEQLLNACHLWKQISEGYARVDEKTQEIARLNLHNESLKVQIAQLETEINGLRTQCEELKYAYTLSKSQDVMQLRQDLREGTSCSVCGATHHPYHSDTLLEQSKLIGEMKTDYEQASTELKHKEALLSDLKREQASREGRIETSYQALEIYKQLLHENVRHWESFASLDRSFKECSPSTNHEARKIMLQQLIEKIGLDAEKAQKELDTFNFHQSNINTLNERISLKELEKNDITVKLNEVNTGCQVIAYRVEQLQQSLSRNNNQYSKLFEEIDRSMSISNWYKVWNENPENLKIYIQQQMRKRFLLQEESVESQNECTCKQAQLTLLEHELMAAEQQQEKLIESIEALSERKGQTDRQFRKLFPNGDVQAYHKAGIEQKRAAEKEKEDLHKQCLILHDETLLSQGYQNCQTGYAQLLEEQIAGERSDLDIWMRKYNAQHSPVQFTELEQTFNDPVDWNELRQTVRNLRLKQMLSEARVEESRLALTAHQVNATSQGQDSENRTAALNAEIARLETEQKNIQVQIAGLQAKLQAHEIGLQKLAANQEDLMIK